MGVKGFERKIQGDHKNTSVETKRLAKVTQLSLLGRVGKGKIQLNKEMISITKWKNSCEQRRSEASRRADYQPNKFCVCLGD